MVRAQEGAMVSYPGLPSHKDHLLLERLRNPGYGHGGILTLDLGSQKVLADSLASEAPKSACMQTQRSHVFNKTL
jgi:cystathionine beta-lyase/cystathionine gamma-synthase